MKRTMYLATLALLVGSVNREARAGLITSPNDITQAPLVLDFSPFASIPPANQISPGTNLMSIGNGVSLGDGVTLTTDDPNVVVGKDFLALGSNGQRTPTGSPFASLNDLSGNLIFSFSMPVSQVGAFLNYAPGFGPDTMIAALSSSGSVLESFDLNTLAPIMTPLDSNGSPLDNFVAFRGIVRPTADIAAFEVSNSSITVTGLVIGTPEPASLTLLSFGLVGLLGYARRRK